MYLLGFLAFRYDLPDSVFDEIFELVRTVCFFVSAMLPSSMGRTCFSNLYFLISVLGNASCSVARFRVRCHHIRGNPQQTLA